MIVELAQITVKPGSEDDFLKAYGEAQALVKASPGYISHTLRRCIETPNKFALIIEWQTLEDHTVGFRGSQAFTQWRALIGPHFASAPVVEHYQ